MTALVAISMREYDTRAALLGNNNREFINSLAPFLNISRVDAKGFCDLTASHWVGSVLLPNGYISVAPKVGGTNALRMMLEGDGELPESWEECLARIECDDLWDALATALGREMSLIRAAGYQGAYLEDEDNRKCVRGKVLPIQDLRFNSPVRYGVYSRDSIWSFDIPLNQALNWASSTLTNFARVESCQSLLAEAAILSGIKEEPPTPDWLPESGDRYRRAIFLTQLVRRAWSSRASLFGHIAPNAIVNMNEVFEAFVRARLRRFLAPHCLIVLEKGSYRRRFSANVQIEPDIVVADRSGRVVAVGDVKYKWQWDFVNADVFQMNAYLDSFPESKIAYIFFPSDACYESLVAEKLPRERFLAPIPISPRDMFRDETWELIAMSITKAANPRT